MPPYPGCDCGEEPDSRRGGSVTMTELQKLRADGSAPVACGLSATPRMRYWKPAQALAGLVSGYHLYAIRAPPDKPHCDVFQPAWAKLRIVLTPGTEWSIRVGEGEWQRGRGVGSRLGTTRAAFHLVIGPPG